MVKIEAAETLGRVADRAVQVFGGMGYCARDADRAPLPRRADLPHLRRHLGDPSHGRRPQRAQARCGAVGHRRAVTQAVPARARAARVDAAAPASRCPVPGVSGARGDACCAAVWQSTSGAGHWQGVPLPRSAQSPTLLAHDRRQRARRPPPRSTGVARAGLRRLRRRAPARPDRRRPSRPRGSGSRVVLLDGAPAVGGQATGAIIDTFCGFYSNGPRARAAHVRHRRGDRARPHAPPTPWTGSRAAATPSSCTTGTRRCSAGSRTR